MNSTGFSIFVTTCFGCCFVVQFNRMPSLEVSNIPTKLIRYVKGHNRRKAATQSQRPGSIP